jgi:hypothetical protein
MTKDDWKEVEDKWDNLYSVIRFKVDGYDLQLQPQIYKSRLVHVVYINDWIKGEWMNEKCEEGRRFYRIKESFLYDSKFRKDMLKICGKKRYKQENYDRKHRSFYAEWYSFSAFKRHLVANNKNIEFLSDN